MTADKIHVLGKRLELYQAADGFRTSTDAVLLAAACPAKSGESVLDLGCGVGSAGLCVAARVPNIKLTGIDIQNDHIDLAKQNAQGNKFTADFICGDVQDLKDERFDHVICNPPYLDKAHTPSPKPAKAIAKGNTDIKIWVQAALRNLKGRGSFTLIHRADHIDAIICAVDGRFGALEIIPLWPKAGVEAKRVVVRGVKDSQSPARIHPGLILHKENGDFTEEAENFLRHAHALV